MFGLWHCVSGSTVTETTKHSLPKGQIAAENFKRAGFIKTLQNCRTVASSAATRTVPVVLGDTNIKSTNEFALALEEAGLTTGSTYQGVENTFIWSECEVKSISNFGHTFTFEPAHLGKFHWDSEDLKIRGPGTSLFDPGFGFLASRCIF